MLSGSMEIWKQKSNYYLLVVGKGASAVKLSNESLFFTLVSANSCLGDV
jgi:hypothetical protein